MKNKFSKKGTLSLIRKFYVVNPGQANLGLSEQLISEYNEAHNLYNSLKGVKRVRTRPSEDFLLMFQRELNKKQFRYLHNIHY